MMSVEISVSQCRGGLAPTASLVRGRRLGSDGWVAAGVSAVGGDGGIPDPAGGDDGVQVARIAAAMTVWAWVGRSLLFSLLVRCR